MRFCHCLRHGDHHLKRKNNTALKNENNLHVYTEEKLVWDFLNLQTLFFQVLYSIDFPTDSYSIK